MPPGRVKVTVQSPAGYVEPEMAETNIVAGKAQEETFILVKLSTLRGEVFILNEEGKLPAPVGVIELTGAKGKMETLVIRGQFALSVAPGEYQLRYLGNVDESVARQLTKSITIGNADTTVKLEAREASIPMRKTLLPKPRTI